MESPEWLELPFSEAVTINPRVQLTRGVSYPFVEMQDIEASQREARSKASRSFSGSGSRFQHGDTLFARITPCLENGKIARFIHESDTSALAHGSTEFIVVRGKADCTLDDYAYYLCRWEDIRTFAVTNMEGTWAGRGFLFGRSTT